MIVTKEILENLSTKHSGYDNNDTVIYFPVINDLPKKMKEVLISKGTRLVKPTKHLIRAHPSRGVHNISTWCKKMMK